MSENTVVSAPAKRRGRPPLRTDKQILKQLRGRKTPATPAELKITSARAQALVEAGQIAEISKRKTGKRGRPATQYHVPEVAAELAAA